MMASGLERQLSRCQTTTTTSSQTLPDFCTTPPTLLPKIKSAYSRLWDLIDANSDQLSGEVWSWNYDAGAAKFDAVPLGSLPPPPGTNPTESNIRQLWSLTFLAVKRNEAVV